MADEPTVSLQYHIEELRKVDREGVKIALDAATEKAKSHNDVLGELRHQQTTFVTKEQVRWAVTSMLAGIAVATAIFAAINGS